MDNDLMLQASHDGAPAVRPHTMPGWWQVWSGGICIALLTPRDVAPILATSANYVADREESPHKVIFANGRTVEVLADGSLGVGCGNYPRLP